MVTFSESQIDSALKRREVKLRGILLHGSDPSIVSELGREVVSKFAGVGRSAPTLLRMDATSIRSDPGRLADEYQSMSLLGERQVVVVDGCDDVALGSLQLLVSGPRSDHFVVLLAGTLSKSSKLRQFCEQQSEFGSVAIYEEDASAAKLRIGALLAKSGLRWTDSAADAFIQLVGNDRGLTFREAEKLALYCIGNSEITVEDILAVCGDAAAFSSDEMIDAVLEGDYSAADRGFCALDREQANTTAVLMQFLYHLQRLQGFRMDMLRGTTIDVVLSQPKPPVFFKRKRVVASQLRNLDLFVLEDMVMIVVSAVAEVSKKSAYG